MVTMAQRPIDTLGEKEVTSEVRLSAKGERGRAAALLGRASEPAQVRDRRRGKRYAGLAW